MKKYFDYLKSPRNSDATQYQMVNTNAAALLTISAAVIMDNQGQLGVLMDCESRSDHGLSGQELSWTTRGQEFSLTARAVVTMDYQARSYHGLSGQELS